MNVILFDSNRSNFYPLSYTRPIAEFRIGILTIKEKWEHYYENVSVSTEDYLADKYPITKQKENLWIDSSVLPSKELITELNSLRNGELLESNDKVIAFKNSSFDYKKLNKISTSVNFDSLNNIWDIFSDNSREIEKDFKLVVKGRKTSALKSSNTVIGKKVFIEKGAKVSCSILNAENGPIFIGKNAEVMEGTIIRGPFAMGENSVLKMGTKIYGPTTLGPYCKVGGEVNNSVFFGYSSKSHDGFLGNSVIGEWCNLGADTNNSNLKNNYAEVKLWNYEMEKFKKTGLQFCGLVMGDHSKCGINTMFNTGTVIGVSANIFGSGFPRNFVPSFSWGGATGFTTYQLKKVFEVAKVVMNRRGLELSETDEKILHHVFDETSKNRTS